MIIASYRNTERGIRAAQAKSVVYPRPQLVLVQPVEPEIDLRKPTALKFARFLESAVSGAAHVLALDDRGRYQTRFDRIAQRLCRVYGLTMADMCSPRRNKATVFARQSIYYWVWRLTALNPLQIGKKLGGRDHTTILHGVTVYQRKRAQMGRYLRELRKGS